MRWLIIMPEKYLTIQQISFHTAELSEKYAGCCGKNMGFGLIYGNTLYLIGKEKKNHHS